MSEHKQSMAATILSLQQQLAGERQQRQALSDLVCELQEQLAAHKQSSRERIAQLAQDLAHYKHVSSYSKTALLAYDGALKKQRALTKVVEAEVQVLRLQLAGGEE